jgi:hypothetical protein
MRTLIVGIDPPEQDLIRQVVTGPVVFHEVVPAYRVESGRLFAHNRSGSRFLEIDRVVFHGIFADDFDFITALALWGGPCLPSGSGLLDCRLRLPCLARARRVSRFGGDPRGFVAPGQTVSARGADTVAKWGNWHCGEGKARFTDTFTAPDEPVVLEAFHPGEAVRVAMVGERAWQIRLTGDGWLKSIHDPRAHVMDLDPELLADTRALAAHFDLALIAVDYIVGEDGTAHLLEVNHAPNVTVFDAMRDAFVELVGEFADAD